MGRLVDIEDVKDLINGLDSLPWEEEVDDLVKTIPTAYDVEKIVADLENMKLIRVEQCHGDYEIEVMTNNNFVDAINIVRKGGIDG